MICPKCEKEFVERNARFCTECGCKLIRGRSSIDIPDSNQSKMDIIINQNKRIIELLENLNKY